MEIFNTNINLIENQCGLLIWWVHQNWFMFFPLSKFGNGRNKWEKNPGKTKIITVTSSSLVMVVGLGFGCQWTIFVWLIADKVCKLSTITKATGLIYVTYKIHPLISYFHSNWTTPQTSPPLVTRTSTAHQTLVKCVNGSISVQKKKKTPWSLGVSLETIPEEIERKVEKQMNVQLYILTSVHLILFQ